jgi:hypothetical protein
VSDTDTKEAEDSGLGVILAIAAGIIAAAVGVVGTYLVMTSVLEYKLEPDKSIYDSPGEGGGGRGGMGPGGKGGMKGGRGGKAPGGKGEKGGGSPDGARNESNGQHRMERFVAGADANRRVMFPV